jgi:uncharacterized protein (DUF2126 family)/transglutaminase-like putative cysteine protease
MGIRVAVRHETRYRYERRIAMGPHVVRLRPAPHTRTPILSYALEIEPKSHFLNWQQDPYANYLARLTFPEKVDRFEIVVDLVADLEIINPFDFFLEGEAEVAPFEYAPELARQLLPFRQHGTWGKRFEEYLASLDWRPRKTIDLLVDFNRRIPHDLGYVIRLEPGIQTPDETLELGRGACRDFAYLQVELLRRVGFAARFVSGYSIQLVADLKPVAGPGGVAADVVDLHAWTEVYLPGAGWVGLDGTSGLLASEGHIPLACSAEPELAAPVSGALEPCETELFHHMEVRRLIDRPRPTRPYEDQAWDAILAKGREVDLRLSAGDVRLTMGGEPTFVSVDDFVGEEWTVAALGEAKRRKAESLVRRLRERFAPGGLLHYGEGKWYPGESLPRWALTCFWRADGEPVWRDAAWIADADRPGSAAPEDAARFLGRCAARLGANPKHVMPAYEDTAYYLWREARLPIDVDPTDPRLDDPEERARIARIFSQGLGTPTGYVLPLERSFEAEALVWRSELWMLRAPYLCLTPGDSPVGLRLPLGSLPWAGGWTAPFFEEDPSTVRRPLPARTQLSRPGAAPPRRMPASHAHQEPGGEAPGVMVRTAISVEPRGGRLHVFLPPLERLEDWLELCAAIEDTARDLGQPVVVEGYPPPPDPRLRVLKVTPDPGVIEVNVHPAQDWEELVSITTGLHDDARQEGLGTTKHLVDGREVGTGGGNHLVLGGPRPLESPFVRRPDLLESLLRFWTNHPSLSRLFSSIFLGPTSQSPRLDEARHDTLYELEIAFAALESAEHRPPWLVDRVFRDLLTDSTGNTHRTEICIDKLYSPDGTAGRQGLVELRGFEMPPHPRMSLAQALLVRALVAAFWERPYRGPLARWGNALNDRFLLPAFVWSDFLEVLGWLGDAGITLDADWYRPQYEFRFPRVGGFMAQGIEVEIRTALEPWHVLGEESAAGSMVRYVDSSVERLEVLVRGLDPSRHAVGVLGQRLPLAPTGIPGERVAAVRFRAWQPAHCLHPTVGVHAPLVFDVVDLEAQAAVGGARYYVGHPGGRSYEEPPLTAYEAEGRRLSRFQPFGHTPGLAVLREPAPHPELPLVLDLRRA